MTTPRLAPFPLRPPTTLISQTFDAWESNGWTEDTDNPSPDEWDPNGHFFSSDFGDLGPGTFSKLTQTFTADDDANPLPANTLVRVAITMDWNLGVGFPGGPGGEGSTRQFGAWVQDVFQQLPGPSFFTDSPGALYWLTRTTADGELAIQVGATGLVGSYDVDGAFLSLTVTTLAAELADIIYDAGVLYIEGNAFSITRGAHAFDPGERWEDYEFPGKRAPIEGLDELVECRPVIRTRCMLTGEYQMTVYRPGGSWGDHATIPGARTFTPANLGQVLATASYLRDVIVVWPRARRDYLAVHFPRAKNLRYGISSADKDEGQIDVELEARIPSGEPITTVPYLIHTYPADTAAPA